MKVGEVPREWVLAPGADPEIRLLYIHGGGFVSGSGGFYLTLAAHISAAARCAVLLPDYRLAPEHRFPAGLEDCIRAHEWMTANGPSGPAPCRATFVAGGSAGGGLTLATLLALHDRKRQLPAGGIPLSPVTDLTLTSESLKTPEVVCYAESRDGIHWVKPNLGLFDWPPTKDNSGSRKNNIIWRGGPETHNDAFNGTEVDVAVTMGCGDYCPLVKAKRREDWYILEPKEFPDDQFREVRGIIERR